MLNLQLAIKYSRAMFLLAQEEGKLVEYGQELQSLSSDIEELKAYLESPMIPRQAKQEAVQKIFGGELSPIVLNFLRFLLDKQRVSILGEIVRKYENFANELQHSNKTYNKLVDDVFHRLNEYFDANVGININLIELTKEA